MSLIGSKINKFVTGIKGKFFVYATGIRSLPVGLNLENEQAVQQKWIDKLKSPKTPLTLLETGLDLIISKELVFSPANLKDAQNAVHGLIPHPALADKAAKAYGILSGEPVNETEPANYDPFASPSLIAAVQGLGEEIQKRVDAGDTKEKQVGGAIDPTELAAAQAQDEALGTHIISQGKEGTLLTQQLENIAGLTAAGAKQPVNLGAIAGFTLADGRQVIAVAEGKNGDQDSPNYILRGLLTLLNQGRGIAEALQAIHSDIRVNLAKVQGAAVSAVMIDKNKFSLLNIGDALVLLMRKNSEGKYTPSLLTVPHFMLGKTHPTSMVIDPARPKLGRPAIENLRAQWPDKADCYFLVGKELPEKLQTYEGSLELDDYLLAISGEALRTLPADELLESIERPGPIEAALTLIKEKILSKQSTSRGNIAVMLYRYSLAHYLENLIINRGVVSTKYVDLSAAIEKMLAAKDPQDRDLLRRLIAEIIDARRGAPALIK